VDRRAIIVRARAKAIEAAKKCNLDCFEDLAELPVLFDDSKRVSRLCGFFQHVTADGLGRIVVFSKMAKDEAFLEKVLLHEYAHAIVHFIRFGRDDEGPHGKCFQYVMRLMGEEPGPCIGGPSTKPPEAVYARR
jgi:hypothetical protein